MNKWTYTFALLVVLVSAAWAQKKTSVLLAGGLVGREIVHEIEENGLAKADKCWEAKAQDGFLGVSLGHFGIKSTELLKAKGVVVAFKLTGDNSEGSLDVSLKGPRGILNVTAYMKDGNIRLPTGLFALTGQVNLSEQFFQLRFSLPKGTSLCNLTAAVWNKGSKPDPIVDGFGQRLDISLPNRIKTIQDLRADASEPMLKPVYQPDKTMFRKTGSFYIHTDSLTGRFTLVDHAGNAFWSRGVTGVRTGLKAGCTEITSANAALFTELPPKNHSAWETKMWFSPYAFNVARKYNSRAEWEAITAQRLKTAGYNTLGNWSDTALCKNQRIPYVVALTTRVPGINKHKGRFPDIFQQGYEDSLVKYWTPLLAYAKNDSLCIGVFVDNELPWANLNKQELPDGPSYAAAEKRFVHNRRFIPYSDIKYLKQHRAKLDMAGLTENKLKQIFRSNWATYYFSTIHEVLKSKLEWPKLYLGCRFTKKFAGPEVLVPAAEYCDVISVNNYDTIPHMADSLYKRVKKPIIIGEFHTPLITTSHVQPNYKSFSKQEVERLRENYFAYLQSKPWCIGAHWYQWVDQPVTGRVGNGENQAVGLVDLQDRWK